MIYSFAADNLSVACPEIQRHLEENNTGQHIPYGEDEHCRYAAGLVRIAFGLSEETSIHFVPTGRAANMLGCAAMLGAGEAIVAPEDGHLAVHERTAIQRLGHQIVPVATEGGELKLSPETVDRTIANYDGAASPRALYVAQATDRGLSYTKDELADLIGYCQEAGLYTLIDGARLANALANDDPNLALQDFGALSPDIFWIGGTKNGGMFGEALVILNDKLAQGFTNVMDQKGMVMPKAWIMGAQFTRFFQSEADGDLLWLRLARNANEQASLIREGLLNLGIQLHYEAGRTNMLFPILPNNVLEKLQSDGYHFYMPARPIGENRSRIRLVCSWDTTNDISHTFVGAVQSHIKQR